MVCIYYVYWSSPWDVYIMYVGVVHGMYILCILE